MALNCIKDEGSLKLKEIITLTMVNIEVDPLK